MSTLTTEAAFFQKRRSSFGRGLPTANLHRKKELADPFALQAAKSVYGKNATALNGGSFHGGTL